MGIFVALAVGYVVGAKTGSKDLDQLTKSLRALRESEEFADVVAAVRSHLGHTLREVASTLDGGGGGGGVGGSVRQSGDMVDRVRQLFGPN
jgi:hypothetical protein